MFFIRKRKMELERKNRVCKSFSNRTGNNKTEIKFGFSSRDYAEFENINAGNYTVETHTTSANWFQNFSNPLQAWDAQLYRNGVGQNWSANHRHTLNNCTTNYPATSAVFGGTLVGASTASFKRNGVPLSC